LLHGRHAARAARWPARRGDRSFFAGTPYSIPGGLEFSENMPEEIRDAIMKARGDGDRTLEDEEYRKRLQDKFGNRWLTTQLVQAKPEDGNDSQAATPTNETAEVVKRERERGYKKRKRRRHIQVIRFRATEGGTGQGVERQVAVDVPKFRYVTKDEFDEDWHLASWVPNDPEGPPSSSLCWVSRARSNRSHTSHFSRPHALSPARGQALPMKRERSQPGSDADSLRLSLFADCLCIAVVCIFFLVSENENAGSGGCAAAVPYY
jgi:hypothetical protein